MAALTAARVQLVMRGTIKKTVYSLAAGAKAFEGGLACFDTGALGFVKQGAVSTTLVPIGWFLSTFDNSAGGSGVPIGVELFREHEVSWWDQSGGAITVANMFAPLFIASDHEVTLTSTGASAFGRMFGFAPQGYPSAIGVCEILT